VTGALSTCVHMTRKEARLITRRRQVCIRELIKAIYLQRANGASRMTVPCPRSV